MKKICYWKDCNKDAYIEILWQFESKTSSTKLLFCRNHNPIPKSHFHWLGIFSKEERWFEHGRDCKEGRRPCGAVDHPVPLADRCENKSYDSKTISAAIEVVKKMGV